MNYLKLYFIILLSFFPLFGCQKSNKSNLQIDNKSYINDFELVQENPNNQTSVKITSPKAIIDPTNNDIEIFKSSIEIYNKDGQHFKVKSANSTLSNSSSSIRVFNDVYITFLHDEDYFIRTNSIDWNLITSIIDINNPLKINFDNSNIIAENGFYNIGSGILEINNTQFYRNLKNSKDEYEYQIEIKSDVVSWLKDGNTLVFKNNDKQVETTINFLLTE